MNIKINNLDELNKALENLKNIDLEPSPFLKTRILANTKDINLKKSNKTIFSFPSKLIFSTLSLAIVIAIFMIFPEKDSSFTILKPYMVKVDISELEKKDIDFVKITLSGVVLFSTDGSYDIKTLRELQISWELIAGRQYLPIVFEGKSEGKGKLNIEFYNQKNELVKNKQFNLTFKDS